MAFIQQIFDNPSVPKWVKRAAVDRINSDPGLPVSNPTKSFWMSSKQSSFASAQSQPLPSAAEYVIIGSGITGTSVARHLNLNRSRRSTDHERDSGGIVILEARDVCGGATGRNGGHINDVGFADYREIRSRLGKEAALKILRFRLSHLDALKQVASEERLELESQIRSLHSATVFFNEAAWKDAVRATKEFKKDMGKEAAEWEIVESEERLKNEFGLETAHGLILGRAGAVWPYKLITGILANLSCADPSFSIHPFTPVIKIEKTCTGLFIVSTPHGDIRTKHVIHCTNSHVSHLIPGLRNRIFPVRGQMSAQSSPSTFPFQGDKTSWSFNYEVGFDYLTQLCKNLPSDNSHAEGGEMMLGGGMAQARYHGIEELGICSDDDLNPEIGAHLSTALSKAFTHSKTPEDIEYGFRVKQMWTGSLGFSVDTMPWVGRVPESATRRKFAYQNDANGTNGHKEEGGEWVAAGYTGEGMVNAWLCGKALASMILGEKEETESWFPELYEITEKRLQESAIQNIVDVENLI